MIAWRQPLVQEFPMQCIAYRQGRKGAEGERCHKEKTVFYIPYLFLSIPVPDRMLVKVGFFSEP